MGLSFYARLGCGLQEVFYSDSGIPSGTLNFTWDSYRDFGVGTDPSSFDGNHLGGIPIDPLSSYLTTTNNGTTYAGWGIFVNQARDMSAFSGGYLRFWVKTEKDLKVEIKDTMSRSRLISQHGWTSGDAGEWKEISIPLSHFGAALDKITGFFAITVEGNNESFYIDDVRWTDTAIPTLNQLVIFPRTATVELGTQKEFFVQGFDLDGTPIAITPTWSVIANPTIGEIISSNESHAIFQGNSQGTATLRASVESIDAFAEINVAPSGRLTTITYPIYTESGLPSGVTGIPQIPSGPPDPTCTTITDPSAPEGNTYYETLVGPSGWGGWLINLPQATDLTSYESGRLRFQAKSPVDLVVKLKGGGIESPETQLTNFGWMANNTWQEVSLPLVDFALKGVDLSTMENVFLISTQGQPGQGTTYGIDHVRYEVLTAVPDRPRVVLTGRQLLIEDVPFTVKGVCYSPTPVGEGFRDFDVSIRPNIYERDFRLMKAIGVNTIRLYSPPTDKAFLDAAFHHGLFVIMDYPIDHGADLPNPLVREFIKTEFLKMVNTWKNHPAILMWNFGNEINFHLNGLSPNDWYSFVNDCAGEAHLTEGEHYHPVIAANAEIAEIGSTTFATTDSDLPNLDAWAIQIYRGPDFGEMFSELALKTSKPVILTEFGCDAYDIRNQREEQKEQANYLQSQWQEIAVNLSETNPSKICIGGLVFSWTDDWSKHQSGAADSVHDTAGFYANSGYYDYQGEVNFNMNEEWWGICGVDPQMNNRQLREAFFRLQNLWRGNSLMDVQIPEGNSLTWTNAVAGENAWKIADHPIVIEAADAFEDNFDAWAIQIYTDNTHRDANPKYTGKMTGDFNLVANENNSRGLAMCWKITDETVNPGFPVWQNDRGDGSEGFSDYQWRLMKDLQQEMNPFLSGEDYIRVWDEKGIYWADHVSADADPFTDGLQPCPVISSSPNFIYVAARLTDSLAYHYSTSRLIIEFIFP